MKGLTDGEASRPGTVDVAFDPHCHHGISPA